MSLLRRTFRRAVVALSSFALLAPTHAGFEHKHVARDLKVTGATAPGALLFGSNALNFGSVTSGQQPELSVTLANPGTGPMTGLALSTTGTTFSAQHSCPAVLPAGSSCLVNVRFAPAQAGTFDGELRAQAPGASAVVALTGSATPAGAAQPSYSSPEIDLGSALVGQATARAGAQLTNV